MRIPTEKECTTCEGSGTVMDDGAPDAVPVECSNCNGTGLVPMTAEDVADWKAERGDRQRDEELDRKAGL